MTKPFRLKIDVFVNFEDPQLAEIARHRKKVAQTVVGNQRRKNFPDACGPGQASQRWKQLCKDERCSFSLVEVCLLSFVKLCLRWTKQAWARASYQSWPFFLSLWGSPALGMNYRRYLPSDCCGAGLLCACLQEVYKFGCIFFHSTSFENFAIFGTFMKPI